MYVDRVTGSVLDALPVHDRTPTGNPAMRETSSMHVTLRRVARTLLIAVSATAVLSACDAWQAPVVTMSQPLVQFDAQPLSDSKIRDRDIVFYTARVAGDPASAGDRLTLAKLLLARSRTASSTRDLTVAESLATVAFSLRSARNVHALEVVASARMARHDFAGAHAAASLADSLEPGNASHLALRAEIELELGEYAAADTHFRAVRTTRDQFTVGARLARWYEVTGHSPRARVLLHNAISAVEQRSDLPREQVAWFHYRLGELELRTGHLAAADSALRRGLRGNPDDVRLLGALARTALAQKDWRGAARYADSATMIQLDPMTLATASRAWTALGDTAQAAQFARAMSTSALTQPGPIHRAWGLHLLDYGTAAERRDVLRRARADLRQRQDVYGHDLMAWALHRTGDDVAARREMQLAMSQATEDVLLQGHAAVLLGVPASR